jgi:GT2 family glycosyltransferase
VITLSYNYLAVIVPTFNRKDITLQFVKSLNSQSIPLRIYVCDSGSTDGTEFAVVSEPNVKLVSAGSSAWWSAAVNEGIQEAKKDKAKLFLVMNDDIEFEQNLISRLLASHNEHPSCILSPLQHTASGQFVGTCYEGIFRRVRHLASIPEDGLVATSNGCCLLIPLAVLNSVGSFDQDNCPHLYGDTEFQLRALKAGFPTRPCESAAIKQMSATNYFGRLRFMSLFTYEGSPLHMQAYLTFGKALFGSRFWFFVLGMRFHFDFLKVLIKILKFFIYKKLKALQSRYV